MTHEKAPLSMGGGASRRLAWSTLDQALSSASNFVLIFLVARGASPNELGYVFIAYSILTGGIVVSRNALGGILSIDLPQVHSLAASELISLSLGAAVAMSLIPSAALVVLSFALPMSQEAAIVILLLAIATPFIYVQDLQRFWAVAEGRSHHAVVSDATWVVFAGAGFWISTAAPASLDSAYGAASWVAGGIAAGGVFMALGYWQTPTFKGVWAWAHHDSRRRNLAVEALIAQLSPLATMTVVTGIAGPQVLAAVRAASTLFGPLNMVSATIPLALVPEAVRSGPQRAQRLFLVTTLGFAAAAIALGLAVHLAPLGTGSALLGETFPLAQSIILITAVEYVGLGVWGVARARFRVEQRLDVALRFRVVFSIAAVILPVSSTLVWGSARALAISMAITAMVVGTAAYISSRNTVEQ